MPTLVCMADVHNFTDFHVPAGDILIVAGDLTGKGTVTEAARFLHWMSSLPHQHKVVVAGNHDFLFERDHALASSMVRAAGIEYLQDTGLEIMGLKFWGSPWQPWFHNWAFNVRGPSIKKYWDLIPDDTDVLVTHGPPKGILDLIPDGQHVGCPELTEAVQRIKPKLHVFGHIHHSHGRLDTDQTVFVNAAVCSEAYRPVQPVQVVEL